jgi:hypothetical protein
MLETSRKNNQMIFQYLPNALKTAKVDLLLVDQVETAPGTVAEFLKLPFISVGNALPSNQEGGINYNSRRSKTVLESLNEGVPLVAIPIADDQPGNAARLSRAGAGEMLSLNRLSVPRLRETIQRVISQPSQRQNAERLKDSLRRAGGVVKAADIVEEVIKTGKPVLAKHMLLSQGERYL